MRSTLSDTAANHCLTGMQGTKSTGFLPEQQRMQTSSVRLGTCESSFLAQVCSENERGLGSGLSGGAADHGDGDPGPNHAVPGTCEFLGKVPAPLLKLK